MALGGPVPAGLCRPPCPGPGLLSGLWLWLVSLIPFIVQRPPGRGVGVPVTKLGCTGPVLSCHLPGLLPTSELEGYLPTWWNILTFLFHSFCLLSFSLKETVSPN